MTVATVEQAGGRSEILGICAAMARERISAAQARRLALGAQGLADPRPDAAPNGWDLRRVLRRVGLLQIDSVNVLERAHYLPAFSRLGPYRRELLDAASQRAPRRLFEYWGHEASLIAGRAASAASLAHGARRARRLGRDAADRARSARSSSPRVLEEVRERGPVSASELTAGERPRRSGPWWDWSESKRALEWLFWSGQVTAARRRRFERLYDLPERVLPAAVLSAPTPPADEAQRELLRIASRALGVAAERDLRDYFRLAAAEAKLRIAELVEAGELVAVEVEGWGRTQGYPDPAARIPRRVDAAALIGPFDSLIWEREPGPADLRLRLPARDLRPGAPAPPRLLRAPVPARRPARRPGRPEGRPRRRQAARPGPSPRARGAGGDPRTPRRRARGDRGLARTRIGAQLFRCKWVVGGSAASASSAPPRRGCLRTQ